MSSICWDRRRTRSLEGNFISGHLRSKQTSEGPLSTVDSTHRCAPDRFVLGIIHYQRTGPRTELSVSSLPRSNAGPTAALSAGSAHQVCASRAQGIRGPATTQSQHAQRNTCCNKLCAPPASVFDALPRGDGLCPVVHAASEETGVHAVAVLHCLSVQVRASGS